MCISLMNIFRAFVFTILFYGGLHHIFFLGFIFVLRGVLSVAVFRNLLGFVEDDFIGRIFR